MTCPALCLVLLLTSGASLAGLPDPAAIDARVRAAMAASQGDGTRPVPLERVAGQPRPVPIDHPWIAAAPAVGTCLGD
jgi:hypothetical protein